MEEDQTKCLVVCWFTNSKNSSVMQTTGRFGPSQRCSQASMSRESALTVAVITALSSDWVYGGSGSDKGYALTRS